MPIEKTKDDTTTKKADKTKLGFNHSYEYLAVYHRHQTNWDSIKDLPYDSRPKQTWTTSWDIYWPNSTKFEKRSGKIEITTLFNELGEEGWKLKTSDLLHSYIDYNHYGIEVGVPLSQRFIFMRRRHV